MHMKMSSAKMVAILYLLQFLYRYSDVIMGAMTPQITILTIFTQSFIQSQIKENIKGLRHWPLWGEFTGDQWIVRTKGQ